MLQPRISEVRKVVVVTPGTFGEQTRTCLAHWAEGKHVVKALADCPDRTLTMAPAHSRLRDIITLYVGWWSPSSRGRHSRAVLGENFLCSCCWGGMSCCCVFCRWSYFYLLLHESLGWSSRNDYSEMYFPLWYRNICYYDIEYSRIQRIPEWINSESEVFLPGN